MRQQLTGLVLASAAVLLWADGAPAQGLAAADVQVIAKVHQANQMEIDAGKLAASRAEAPKVKRYGELLVRDHQSGDKAVVDLARQKGIEQIPTPVPERPAEQEQMQKQMAAMEQLKGLTGAAFDRAFTDTMIQDHDNAITMLRGAVQKVGDNDLRNLLRKLLPILEQHREIAQELNRQTTTRR